MKWFLSRLVSLGISLFLSYAATAHSTILRPGVAGPAHMAIKRALRHLNQEKIQTWDLLLVEDHVNQVPIHVGMAFKKPDDRIVILEAAPVLGVASSEIVNFRQQNRKNTIFVLRPQEQFLEVLQESNLQEFWSYFKDELLGNPYNYAMLYDFHLNGKKHYYCSQLLRDMYNHVLEKVDLDIMPLEKMDFHEEFARKLVTSQGYEIPYGELGVSPEHFSKFNFDYLGYLSN